MLRVALTGGLGSGKSTAAKELELLGAAVSSSDEVARRGMRRGAALFAPIVQRFGPGVVSPDGELDRAALARAAFDGERVAELESIVHPWVIAEQRRWMEGLERERPDAVAVVESALTLETKFGAVDGVPWAKQFDRIVLVVAPEELRLQRALARAGAAEHSTLRAQLQARIARQMPPELARQQADFVLDNSGSTDDLRAAVRALWLRLQQEAAR